jgi:hypothetical protein
LTFALFECYTKHRSSIKRICWRHRCAVRQTWRSP